MTTLNEGGYITDVLKFEEEGRYSRELKTIASGAGVLKIGTVLGLITASGKYVPVDPVTPAIDGSQVAAAVLIQAVDATAADVSALVVERHCVVADNGLIWPAGISAPQTATAISELEAAGIITRTGA